MSQLNYKRQIIYCAPQKEKQQQQKKKNQKMIAICNRATFSIVPHSN